MDDYEDDIGEEIEGNYHIISLDHPVTYVLFGNIY